MPIRPKRQIEQRTGDSMPGTPIRVIEEEILSQVAHWRKETTAVMISIIVSVAPANSDDESVKRALDELRGDGSAEAYRSLVAFGPQEWQKV